MAYTAFITEQYLKETTPLNGNVEMTQVQPFLQSSEDLFIKDTLGSKMFDSLKVKFIAQTLSADEITLVGFIKPALAWQTFASYLPFAKTEVRNKGTVQLRGEFEESAELANVKYIRSEATNMAEYYLESLKQYLCNYGNLYTDYTHPDSKGKLPNSESAFDCDLYLGTNYDLKRNKYYYGSN